MSDGAGKNAVAVVLAVSLATAINIITAGILYDAIRDPANAGISENATQILTTAFGGIIGVLGGFVGYQKGREAGRAEGHDTAAEDEDYPDESDSDG